MSIYTWICMYEYIYEYICWVYMFICMSIHVWVFINVWVYIYEYVYMYECICLNNYWFMSIYVWLCTYKHVSIYICMHVMLCYHWVTNHCGCCYYNEQYGWTALMKAAQKGHGAIVTYLVEQGANKDLQSKVSIHLLRMIIMMIIIIIMMMMS